MTALLQSAHEALQIARKIAKDGPGRWEPPSADMIKKLRHRLKLSQSQFAACFGLDLKSLQQWEQERRSPEQVTCLLLGMIDEDSNGVAKLVRKVAKKQRADQEVL
jgi:putative transcriptional regulator